MAAATPASAPAAVAITAAIEAADGTSSGLPTPPTTRDNTSSPPLKKDHAASSSPAAAAAAAAAPPKCSGARRARIRPTVAPAAVPARAVNARRRGVSSEDEQEEKPFVNTGQWIRGRIQETPSHLLDHHAEMAITGVVSARKNGKPRLGGLDTWLRNLGIDYKKGGSHGLLKKKEWTQEKEAFKKIGITIDDAEIKKEIKARIGGLEEYYAMKQELQKSSWDRHIAGLERWCEGTDEDSALRTTSQVARSSESEWDQKFPDDLRYHDAMVREHMGEGSSPELADHWQQRRKYGLWQ